MDPACEEEASRTWFNAALQKSPNFPPAGHTAASGEQGVLLTKHPGGADLDHGCPKVLVFRH